MKGFFMPRQDAPEHNTAKNDNVKNGKGRLILVSGLSGAGKSTLARSLAAALPDAVLLDSDVMRKELYGVPPTQKLPEEAYAWEFTKKLIAETERRIAQAVGEGKTVVQTVVLVREEQRERQEEFARSLGADFQGLWLQAEVATLFKRVSARKNDASDAGVEMVERQSDGFSGSFGGSWAVLDAAGTPDEVLQQALDVVSPVKKPVQKTPKTAGPSSP